ncbi:MAG: hypothetical protein NTW21_11380 [Verrucomicrobia bacterium]|nr:hypothetical protein [Verrucomicrobiota bacterium]
MKQSPLTAPLAGIGLWGALVMPLAAEVRLPKILTDHMIPQQHAEVTLWGWTNVAAATVEIVEIAGADGRFVPATAAVMGEEVLVSSSTVASPVAVRLSWGGGCFQPDGQQRPACGAVPGHLEPQDSLISCSRVCFQYIRCLRIIK